MQLGMIGLGRMGANIVRRLMANGHTTVVYDRNTATVKELAGEGAAGASDFKDFVAAMKFVNRVADIAEAEGHHPDIHIHYNRVRFDIFTHAIDGLSENDFILAAKIDSVSS